jgi:hypothetical protein
MAFYFSLGGPKDVNADWLLAGESQGFAVDATMEGGTVTVKDTTTTGNKINNRQLDQSCLVQGSTSPKMVKWNADPYLRWAPHNLDTGSIASWWVTNTGLTFVPDAAIAPDGNMTAAQMTAIAASTAHNKSAPTSPATIASVVYTMSIYVKAASSARYVGLAAGNSGASTNWYAADFDLQNPTAPSQTVAGSTGTVIGGAITDVGNGWYRISVTGSHAQATTYYQVAINASGAPTHAGFGDITWTPAGTESFYVWGPQFNLGYIPTTYLPTNNIGRVGIAQEYDSAEGKFAILAEPAGTNLILRSQEFDNASWIQSNTSVIANSTTAPDGSITADEITVANIGNHAIRQDATVVTLTGYTTSCFFKVSSGAQWIYLRVSDNVSTNGVKAWFDIQNGVVGSQTALGTGWTPKGIGIETIGNGWYRCSSMYVTTGTASRMLLQAVTADNSTTSSAVGTKWYAWGAQVEFFINRSSYIPTLGSTVTRAADNISVLPALLPAGALAPVSAYLDIKRFSMSGTAAGGAGLGGNDDRKFAITNTDSQNSMLIRTANGFETLLCQRLNVAQFGTLDFTEVPTQTRYQLTAIWNNNDGRWSMNGTDFATPDTVCTMPVGITGMHIGSQVSAQNGTNGYFYRIVVVPRAVTAAEQAGWRYNYI